MVIFKQYTDEGLLHTKLNDFSQRILPILSTFFYSFKKKLPEVLQDRSEIECMLLFLNSFYTLMNYGYFTILEVKNFIGVILDNLVDYDPFVFRRKRHENDFIYLHNKIIGAFLNILNLYEDIWVELYGLQFLQSFYFNYSYKNYVKTHSEF